MTDISHLIDLSDDGSWKAILPFCVNIQVLNQAADDSTDADRLAVPDVSILSHTKDNTDA